MSKDRKNRIFLSYANENLDKVKQVYEGLIKRGLEVWFDKEDLGPGKWKPQITRAITKSRYFVICLSKAAIRKTGEEPGFQDEELNEAYEIAKNQPDTEFNIIPIRLEDCGRGDNRLKIFHQYDIFDNFTKGLDKLAVKVGGVSLSDQKAKDERTDTEKLKDTLRDKAAAEYFAGRFMESITLLEMVLALSADDVEAWIGKGVVLHNLGRYTEALVALNKALEIDSDNAIAWTGKGVILHNLGRYDEVLVACDKSLKIDPDSDPVWLLKGTNLASLDRYDEALVAFNKALEINPDFAVAWNNKGTALSSLDRKEKAIDAFNKALQIDSHYVDVWIKKGYTSYSLGRKKEAIDAFNKALEIDPTDANAWTGKGIVLQSSDQKETALAAFNKAILFDPDFRVALVCRDDLMKKLKNND